MGFKKGQSGNPKGRTAGTPNRATADVREAIARLLQSNVEEYQTWLSQVAQGIPAHEVKPDPAKALDIVSRLAEYHIPKLSRSEVSGTPGGEPVRLVIGS